MCAYTFLTFPPHLHFTNEKTYTMEVSFTFVEIKVV
jgi:hypothetical protein